MEQQQANVLETMVVKEQSTEQLRRVYEALAWLAPKSALNPQFVEIK